MRDPKLASLPQQSSHNGVLRVRVNTSAGAAELVSIVEKWSAGRLLERLVDGPAEEGASREGEDEDVFWGDALLLDSRRGQVDLFSVADARARISCSSLDSENPEKARAAKLATAFVARRSRAGVSQSRRDSPIPKTDSSPGARDPAELVEVLAQRWDKSGWVQSVAFAVDERVIVGSIVRRRCEQS